MMFLRTLSLIHPITFNLFDCFFDFNALNLVSKCFLLRFLHYLGKVKFLREYLLPLWMTTIFYFARMESQASITLWLRMSVSPNEGTEPLFPYLLSESLEIHRCGPAMVKGTLRRSSAASQSISC